MYDLYRDEAIKQTVLNADLEKRLENAIALLEKCDFWLAHLEDFTKGEAGNEITKLRVEIETTLNQKVNQ